MKWEKQELCYQVHNVVLQENTIDRWRWSLDPIHGYSVKGVYTYLSTANVLEDHGVSVFEGVCQKQVPFKESVFSWRLLRNRLPTKDNLIQRRIIQHDNVLCIGGCGSGETADHILFQCDYFSMVWHRIYQWLGISFTAPASVTAHFHQFGHLAGLPRVTYSYLTVIWHASVWTIWKEWNNRIFNQRYGELDQLADSIKLLSFSWLNAKMPTLAFNYNDWWRHPLICMGALV